MRTFWLAILLSGFLPVTGAAQTITGMTANPGSATGNNYKVTAVPATCGQTNVGVISDYGFGWDTTPWAQACYYALANAWSGDANNPDYMRAENTYFADMTNTITVNSYGAYYNAFPSVTENNGDGTGTRIQPARAT